MHTGIGAFGRIRRKVALVLLASYSALVLLLALHHHPPVRQQGEAFDALPAVETPHSHIAANCPLLPYSVSAFLALPAEASVARTLPVSKLLPEPLRIDGDTATEGVRQSRAPPANA